MDRDDDVVREEEEAPAAEARAIGGNPGEDPMDADPDRFDGERGEAFRAVEEAGGGEAEGFEQAERALAEEASHGDSRRSPEVDTMTPEEEADRASAVYSEPDEVDPTEVTSDPREGPDDPGRGPGIAPER